ncbi:MAG TPA: O-antigen ligase family protein, partial [Solirubrobacterales bacterium]|nr:O-antigen ligase family protein [Solirubrobacterales bacterium]
MTPPIRPARAAILVAAAVPPVVLALDSGGFGPVLRQEIGAAAAALLAAGIAAGFLPRGAPVRWVLVAAAGAAALLAWTGLSLAWTESSERTVAELARLAGYLSFAAIALLGLTRATFRAAAAGLGIAALGIAALAVASRLFPGALPGATDVADQFHADRLTYPLDYWNAVGAWCAMSLAIALAWSSHARSQAVRAATLAVAPVAGLGVYLTYSRAGVISSAVAVLAVLALSRHRWTALAHAGAVGAATGIVILAVRDNPAIADATGGAGGGAVLAALIVAAMLCAAMVFATGAARVDRFHLSRRGLRAAATATAVAAGVALVVAWGPLSDVWSEFRSEEQVGAGSDPAARLTEGGGNRDDLWGSALAAFSAHPLEGTGPGTFEFWWSRDARDPEYVRDAHSLYLETMAELGLPGLLALLALLAGLLGAAIQARTRLTGPDEAGISAAMIAAFAVFLVSAAVDWQWEVGALALLALLAAATAAAAGTAARASAGLAGRRAWVRPAAATVALAAAAVQVPGIVSNERLEASQAAARDGDLARA